MEQRTRNGIQSNSKIFAAEFRNALIGRKGMFVFLLKHIRSFEYEPCCEKVIGIYTSKERAEEEAEVYKSLPGFRDFSNGFVIKRYELIRRDYDSTVNAEVYFLQHEYSVTCQEEVFDISTDIGIFQNKEDANCAMTQLKNNIVFLNRGEGLYSDDSGFCISMYHLNESDWIEGFDAGN